jgi:hypothetical protein
MDILVQHLRGAYEHQQAIVYPRTKRGYVWVQSNLETPRIAGTLRRVSRECANDIVAVMRQDGLDVEIRTS